MNKKTIKEFVSQLTNLTDKNDLFWHDGVYLSTVYKGRRFRLDDFSNTLEVSSKASLGVNHSYEEVTKGYFALRHLKKAIKKQLNEIVRLEKEKYDADFLLDMGLDE